MRSPSCAGSSPTRPSTEARFSSPARPDVGKTALLSPAAETARAAGTTVLWAAGVQFEADMSFSGLNELLLPLQPAMDGLTPARRRALSVALGLSDGLAAERLIVNTAALALVQRAARDRPLLMLVDDVPWLDRPSALVPGFIARRSRGAGSGSSSRHGRTPRASSTPGTFPNSSSHRSPATSAPS
jgi:hypothetical protein